MRNARRTDRGNRQFGRHVEAPEHGGKDAIPTEMSLCRMTEGVETDERQDAFRFAPSCSSLDPDTAEDWLS
jgi:hypothetical protein